MTAALWAASSSAWAQQVTLLSDDFEAGAINATNFPTVSRGQLRTGTSFPSQSLWFTGNPGSGDRTVVTKVLNVSAGGGSVQFDLRYQATGQGSVTDFNELDGGETITLSYTTDGVTFVTLASFLSSDATYSGGFATFSATLPVGAETSTTQIRWQQTTYNNGADNWAIDNVLIQANMVAVPEPGTWALYGLGATGLLAAVRRRRAAAKSAATTTTKV